MGVTPNDAPDADGVQNFPLLTSAVPTGGTTAVAGQLSSGASKTYTVTLYSNAACDATGFGEGQTLLGHAQVLTDVGGNAVFSIPVGSSLPVGSFVTATATAPDGSTSELSQCVSVGPDNDTWTRALDISSGSTTGFIDQSGQARWYKFTITPGERVTVDLTNLPANYDLALFTDIGQAFNSLTAPRDLQHLSAEFAGDAFSPSVFSPSVFSPVGVLAVGVQPVRLLARRCSRRPCSARRSSPRRCSRRRCSAPRSSRRRCSRRRSSRPSVFSPDARPTRARSSAA